MTGQLPDNEGYFALSTHYVPVDAPQLSVYALLSKLGQVIYRLPCMPAPNCFWMWPDLVSFEHMHAVIHL